MPRNYSYSISVLRPWQNASLEIAISWEKVAVEPYYNLKTQYADYMNAENNFFICSKHSSCNILKSRILRNWIMLLLLFVRILTLVNRRRRRKNYACVKKETLRATQVKTSSGRWKINYYSVKISGIHKQVWLNR